MSDKNIKDYLHLYLECECMIGDLNWKSPNIAPEDREPYTDPEFGKPIKSKIDLHTIQAYGHKLTPILRPLLDMTDEESKESSAIWFGAIEKHGRGIKAYAIVSNWYRKNQFDIDGLIESGLAIDKTKIIQQ